MNFAINLIMAGIFLRLANIRTLSGFDMFPDIVGAAFIITAIIISKKYAGEIRRATIPAVLYFVLSLGSFYNFIDSNSTGLHFALYLFWLAAYTVTEIWLYIKLMAGCCEMYDEQPKTGDKAAVALYGISQAVGGIIAYMLFNSMTIAGNTEPFGIWNVIYYIYLIINIIITAFLIYRFYLRKPKFR